MQPILSYQTRVPQIHLDPDGTLHIGIPPVGFLRAVKVRSSLKSEIGLLLTVVSLGALLVVLGSNFQRFPDKETFYLVALMEMALVGGLLVIVFYRARVRVHIRATAAELNIETDGLGVCRRFQLARDKIADIDARPREEDYHRPISLCVRRKGTDKAAYFLNHLSEADVRQVTELLQQALNI